MNAEERTSVGLLRWSQRAVAVSLGLLIAGPFCFHVIRETDAGWHLALGRLIETSGIPFRNALSWTAPNEPWYATSWLYDWISARAALSFGVRGLQCTTFIFLGLTLLGIALAAERVERHLGVWVAPLAGLLLIGRVTERPHVATWVVLAWVVFLCVPDEASRKLRGAERDAAGWRRRLLCVPLIALGSNLHSGAAFAAIVFGLSCLEAYWLGARRRRELVLAAVGGAALMANPGGVFNVEYVLKHLHVQEVIVLQEFLRPNLGRERAFYILVPLTLLLAWRVRREWPALLAILGVFAVLGFRAVRVVYEFEVIAAVALALAFAWLRERWNVRAAALVVAASILALVMWRLPWLTTLEMAPTFDANKLPVRAAEFIRAEHLDGRFFNGFRDGGYLEWALPELPSFQDARVQAWPPEFFAREQQAEKSPESFRAWLKEWDCEWALATRVEERLAGFHQLDSPDWALVYWDEASEIFVRRDVPRLASLVQRLEYRHFRPYGRMIGGLSSASQRDAMEWLAELNRFQQTAPQMPEAWLVRCAALTRLGRDSEEACAKAASLVDTERGQKLLAVARSLPVATQ